MSGRLIWLVSLAFALELVLDGASNAADPDLVGWWKFEESGGILEDSSDQQNDGSFNGTLYQQPGVVGYALGFDGIDDRMTVGANGRPTDTFSFGGWMATTATHESDAESSAGVGGVNGQRYAFDPAHGGAANGGAGLSIGTNGISVYEHGANYMPVLAAYEAEIGEDWNHIMIVYDNKQPTIYLNGQAVHTGLASPRALVNAPIAIGGMAYGFFEGLMDEIQIYSRALTQRDVLSLVGGERAYDPIPEDGAADVLRDADLSWQAGEFAVNHDVFVGTRFDDVNDATSTTDPTGAYQGRQSETSYELGRLAFSQTYYWRIDEVNGAPDNTVFKGEVWSFEVEPFSIPVETVVVTASSANDDTMSPENTINASGLDELDQHSTDPKDMWLSASGDQDVWIQYEFDQPYKLDKLLVWNSNQLIEAFVGLGAKEVVIETSADGESWTVLAGATQFAQAPGAADYVANTIIDFGGVLAQYVRIKVLSGYGPLGQFGLSELRFLYIPTFAREPQPADGEATEGVDVLLKWRPGHEAVAHEVYLGTDPADLALAATTDAPPFLAQALDYDQSYYWQVIEINETETPAAHAGPIWSISTPAYGVVDDFDPYDDNCKRIFFAWEDGLGHNGGEGIEGCDEPASNGNGGGSIVGNAAAPFAEKMIVYAGTQSMPLEYDNAFGASEATLRLPSQDWTGSGIKSLSLYVFGGTDNTGQLYLKINNTRVDGAPDISQPGWQPWNIDLSTVGGNLQNVTSLTFGIDGANAAGKLYIDAIRLYPQVRESGAPALSYVKITGDEDCGISADNTYTHALDFGQGTPGALINGVQFEAYNAAANGSLNFMRESSSGAASDHAGNGNHNVAGSLVDLLTDMYYNGGNAPGGTTTWTLSGLTAGQTYHTRIYTRQWGASDSRNVAFVFDPDGPGPISDSTGKVSQDNASSVGFANGNDAYYINYQFTAVEGEDLVITLTQDNLNYSWHLYGLTNQEVALE